jgi:hypothetical protein
MSSTTPLVNSDVSDLWRSPSTIHTVHRYLASEQLVSGVEIYPPPIVCRLLLSRDAIEDREVVDEIEVRVLEAHQGLTTKLAWKLTVKDHSKNTFDVKV